VRIGWWLYSVALIAIGCGRMVERMMHDAGGPPSRFGPVLGALVLAVGVVGYAHRRPLGARWIWSGVLALSCLATAGLLWLEYMEFQTGAPYRVHALLVGAAAFLIPAQIALHQYVFRRPEIWRRRPQPPDGFAG